MKLSWGWKIAGLYSGFVIMMVCLVAASSHQKSYLVSKDYYKDEIAYQGVLDASRNQSKLSAAFTIHANGEAVIIDFPEEFKNSVLGGDVKFYSPVNEDWDCNFKIKAEHNSFSIPRSKLHKTRYTMKINCIADGKSYYQESEISLHI